MRVEKTMIHPELRKTGELIRFFLPSFTERKFHMSKTIMKRMKGKCRSKLHYEQIYIPRLDGSSLRLCVYSPLSTKKGVPGLLWFHGGGFAIGIPEQDEGFIWRFVEASGCVVVSPDYTLSIDAPYPSALEDCYAALLWLKEHGSEYGMNSDQIFVGGDSAGGGLTAAVTMYARDKGEVAIAFQMPLYPMLDDRMETESAKDNDAPLWNSKSNEVAWRLYLGELFGKPDVPVYAAPGRAADYNGLPPTCSFVGSVEPFHDETVSYIENLSKCGVPTHFKVFDGCFHAFDLIGAKTSVGKEAVDFLMATFNYAVEHYTAQQPEHY